MYHDKSTAEVPSHVVPHFQAWLSSMAAEFRGVLVSPGRESTEAEPRRPTSLSETSRLQRLRPDLFILIGYLAIAVYVFGHLWWAPGSRYLPHSYSDQFQFEWFLAADTHRLLALQNPLFSDLQNASVGVNMMGNASVLGLAVPLLPITMLFGASTSFVLALTLGFTGTAFGWYWVLRRDLHLHRAAAVLGGAFAAFAPSIVSHGNGHLNLVSMFLIPWIVRQALHLFVTTRPVRTAVVLGLLVAYQVFIGEEILLITTLALALFCVVFAVPLPAGLTVMLRRLLMGLVTALAVAVPLLAYPLYIQFAGPQHYEGLGNLAYVTNDLNTIVEWSTTSFGNSGTPLTSTNFAEENAYFGWPLLILAAAITVWLRRDRLVRACAAAGAFCLFVSLGPTVILHGMNTNVKTPWALLQPVPLLNSINVARFTFVTVMTLAVLLAVATHRVLTAQVEALPMRLIWACALAMALVPLLPRPLPTMIRAPVPQFFIDGRYRDYVGLNDTLVAIPQVSASSDPVALSWQMAANMNFRLPEGYFMGPAPQSMFATNSPPAGATTSLINSVRQTGQTQQVDLQQKAAVIDELRRWRADAIVVYQDDALPQLRQTLDPLFGAAQHVDDVWLWDLRPLTHA